MSSSQTHQPHVCRDESEQWRACLQSVFQLGRADKAAQKMDATCVEQRAAFDVCAANWRKEVGDAVKLRGDHPGEAPAQCRQMACVYESCMSNAGYDNAKCTGALQQFKHCVKALHGSEYVLD